MLLQRFREVARARLHLIEQPGVFDCDHGLIGKGLEESPFLVTEIDVGLSRDRHHADAAVLPHHRRDKIGEVSNEFGRAMQALRHIRTVQAVGVIDLLAGPQHGRC